MQRALLDTNLLLLLIVGTFDRKVIPRYRRTQGFTPSDYDLLLRQLSRFGVIATTPGILTETSNLLGNEFHVDAAATLVATCAPFLEIHHPKQDVFAQIGFDRLGFADASILASIDPETVVLTDDVALYNQVLYLGGIAQNFNHLRSNWD